MKRLNYLYILLFGIFFSITSCSSEDNSPEPQEQTDDTPSLPQNLSAETRTNVSYGNNPQQVYDLYLPAGRNQNKTKMIILVHGGGWIGGDKNSMENFIQLIQENHPDHAILNMNYVLATSADTPAFPNQILDIGVIIAQISAQFEDLQIKPEFGLIGVSAGAHLSLVYDYSYDTDNKVKFVADIVGPSDFTDPFYANDPSFNLRLDYLVDETAYPADTDYASVLSPSLLVSNSSSPTIMFYGNQDPLVPLTNAQSLNAALTANDVTHSFTVYDGGHGNWDAEAYIDLQMKLSAFIKTHLTVN